MARRRTNADPLPPCYAMVHPGLEPIAEEEVATDLHGEVKKTARGFIIFRVPEISEELLQLRTVEDVYLLAWGTDELTYRAKDLDKIRDWTRREAKWDRLLRIHQALLSKTKKKSTYRLVTQMQGEHGYRRIDAKKALAEGLAGKIPATWRMVEDNASVEIWLTIQGSTAVCGVRLSDRSMRHRSQKREHLPASLRPTIAAAMVRLAEIQPKQTILDPMCGSGTILGEAHVWAKQHGIKPLTVWGGDISSNALLAAGPNLRSLGHTHLARWDAGRLPLRDRSIDTVLCNPPFGKQMSNPEEIGPLYESLLREVNRVLKPRGRALLLVSDPHTLRDHALALGWTRHKQHRIRILGQVAFLSVWQPGYSW